MAMILLVGVLQHEDEHSQCRASAAAPLDLCFLRRLDDQLRQPEEFLSTGGVLPTLWLSRRTAIFGNDLHVFY